MAAHTFSIIPVPEDAVAELVKTVNTPAIAEAFADAQLLELARRLGEAWSGQLRAERTRGDSDAAYREAADICFEIEMIRPSTLDGLRVKALAVRWCHCFEDELDLPETTDRRLLQQIVGWLAGGW